jgi:hypothetical protein
MQNVIESVVESQSPSGSTNPTTKKPGQFLSAELSQAAYLNPWSFAEEGPELCSGDERVRDPQV